MKNKPLILSVLLMSLFICGNVCAQDVDLVHIGDSQYFSIFVPEDFDISEFLADLKYDYFLSVDSLKDPLANKPIGLLKKTLDELYTEASDALGIHVYSFHGSLKIYPDKESLSAYLKSLYNVNVDEISYYLHEKRTIYLSNPDITLGILGHEIAHAIISNYFVVLPPAKVQEILSGYVEFNLRKQTRTLP